MMLLRDKTNTNHLERLLAEEEEATAKLLAAKYKLPYINLFFTAISRNALALLKREKAEEAKLAIFQKQGMRLSVAVHSPQTPKTKEALTHLTKQGYHLVLFFSSTRGLVKAWSAYPPASAPRTEISGEFKINTDLIRRFQKEITNVETFKNEITRIGGSNISQFLELTFATALNVGVSDIHLEPEKERTIIRFRIDGVLQNIAEVPSRTHSLILSRIKLLAGLKLNIHNVALDGRLTITLERNDIEIRISILPAEYRESVSLRILNPKNILSIEELGIRKDLEGIFLEAIAAPSGMILSTGPTGSGKTTTLYACLKYLASPERKVITIEDPIEYRLLNISQTQVNEKGGYDFKNGLKHILRQDPDIILVGEIRDLETAQTAINASLTGHLVFSTLHANDALGTVPRLVDMGAKPSFFAPALRLLIAQRLVRRICTTCSKKRKITKEELPLFKKELARLPDITRPTLTPRTLIPEARGCSVCSGSGYRGRIGVFEMLPLGGEIEKLISQSSPLATIREFAEKQGMVTMKQDGLIKVLQHITSLEETKRVLG